MAAIEPNGTALLCYVVLCAIACVAALVLAGMLPLHQRDHQQLGGAALVVADAALLLVLVAWTALYAYGRLRWTSLVVAGGLVFLFAPALFQAWPERWRDGRAGLVIVMTMLFGGLALLRAAPAPAF